MREVFAAIAVLPTEFRLALVAVDIAGLPGRPGSTRSVPGGGCCPALSSIRAWLTGGQPPGACQATLLAEGLASGDRDRGFWEHAGWAGRATADGLRARSSLAAPATDPVAPRARIRLCRVPT